MEDSRQARLLFILSELYNKICSCKEEAEGNLNPIFHKEGCLYRLAVEEEENIQWTEQTQDS